VINGGRECGSSADHPEKAVKREGYFKAFLQDMGLDPSLETDIGCVNEEPFLAGSAGHVPSYFEKGAANQCNLVANPTGYHLFAQDDYKRCVCDSHGQGEQDCP